jgi:asparagine synthase (glutamine-hydrolysing)
VPNPALLARVVRDGGLTRGFATTRRWPRPSAERLAALELNAAAAGPFYRAMSAAYGISIRNPTTDVRLVEYCFGIPENLYWIDGDERTLLKRSMRELMPERILTSTTRGRQSADLRARFLASAAEVDSLLERFDDSDGVRAYVDVAALRTAWREVRRDDRSDALLTHVKLPRALMTGLAVLNVLDEGVPHG